MAIRKTIFWLHLGAGWVMGRMVAITSVTGVAIAIDRDMRAIAVRVWIQLLHTGEVLGLAGKPFAPQSLLYG